FQTFAVGPVTAYDLWWDAVPEAIFAALTTALEAAPETLGCKVSVEAVSSSTGRAGAVRVQLLGQLFGSRAELLEILHPVYAVAAPSSGRILETTYWKAQDFLSEAGEPDYYQERSRFFDRAIGGDAVAAVFDWMRRWPGNVKSASFKVFQTGGRVNAVAPGATAFVHRNSHWLSSIGLVWHADTPRDALQRNLQWQADFYAAIVPLAQGGAYQNFIDPSLSDWKQAYYGSNLARLETIKKRFDPSHVFEFPEAIP
ncbi:MAG TPA: BBE domain-containing protein, partial [Candidatus Baltobacteraceae bacterium]|nr:BBE domain-containing protein [Candidatus Baltobacteraceae bacterium]